MTTDQPQGPDEVQPERTTPPASDHSGHDGHDGHGRRGRRGRRRLVVLAAATALAVAAVTGGGVALANRSAQAAQQTTASGATSGTTTLPNGLTAGRGPRGIQPGTSGSGTDANGYPLDPGSGGGTAQGSTGTRSGTTNAATSAATAAQEVGLVEITSELTTGEAAGTGMILSSTGEVVTNHHVVAGATSIKVTVASTGATYTARFVGANATTDVAVLQLVDASGLTPVQLDATGAAVGENVTAVGNAGGTGSLTAAPGTVTAESQAITVQGDDGTASRLTGLIELASDIVPGDSGGAVVDAAGKVVAMNVAASSGTSTVTGYAIPISTVMSVVNAVEAGQSSATVTLGYGGYLGIGLTSSSSATVYGVVRGGPAAAAGLVGGDTITAIGGTAVTTADDVHAAVAAHHAGDKVTVTWTTRAGSTRFATVTLGEAPIA